jgi:hypothetical protein
MVLDMKVNGSCKNYITKVYTIFAKVVVLVTRITTKLVLQFLDFFMILYEFCKPHCQNTQGREDSIYIQALEKIRRFTTIPLVRTETPGTRKVHAVGSLGARGGAVRRIPARPAVGLAGEEVERCLWVTRAPCAAGFGVGKAPVRSPDDAREMRPWCCAFPRRDARG